MEANECVTLSFSDLGQTPNSSRGNACRHLNHDRQRMPCKWFISRLRYWDEWMKRSFYSLLNVPLPTWEDFVQNNGFDCGFGKLNDHSISDSIKTSVHASNTNSIIDLCWIRVKYLSHVQKFSVQAVKLLHNYVVFPFFLLLLPHALKSPARYKLSTFYSKCKAIDSVTLSMLRFHVL